MNSEKKVLKRLWKYILWYIIADLLNHTVVLNCVLLISFYDLVLPKVLFSPNFLFFSFFSLHFFLISKPFDYFPPPTGRGEKYRPTSRSDQRIDVFPLGRPTDIFLSDEYLFWPIQMSSFNVNLRKQKEFCKSVQSFRRYDQKRCVCRTRNGDNINAVLLGFGGKTRFNLRPGKLRCSQNEVKIMERGQSSCAKGS